MPDSLSPAKLPDRFLAYLLDLLPFTAGYFATLYFLIGTLRHWPNTDAAWRRIFFAWVVLYLIYQVLGNLSGATIGKRTFGLRVLRTDGEPLTPAQAVLRGFGYLLSTPLLNLGFLWSFVHPESRGWHDLLSGSVVVEERERNAGAAFLSLVLAVLSLTGIVGAGAWMTVMRPSPRDQEAMRAANDGLRILAGIEESYKRKTGRYTDSLLDLAIESGDVKLFKESMRKIFDPDSFLLEADSKGYSIRAKALDRRKSPVRIDKKDSL